jgi:inosine/xanthosine triphosphatase
MKRIVIASGNPVKIQAALNGFRRMFPGEEFSTSSVSAPSDVSDQPGSDREALQGAANRAHHARQMVAQAEFWVGIEGGVEDWGTEMAAFAWVVVLGNDLQGKGRSGTFFLPEAVTALVREGKELGEADDIVFNRSNSKQENGAIGILTGNVIDRVKLYEEAIILALVPFKNRDLF